MNEIKDQSEKPESFLLNRLLQTLLPHQSHHIALALLLLMLRRNEKKILSAVFNLSCRDIEYLEYPHMQFMGKLQDRGIK